MQNLLPSKDPQSMLALQAERVADIKTAAGVPPHVFEQFYLPVLVAFAGATQSLPLSSSVFKHQGGAFEFGLIAAMVALRYAKSQVFFPDAGSEDRRSLEPQCRYAAFVATLASTVTMVAESTCIQVDGELDAYHPLVSQVGLDRWLRENPSAVITWRTDAAPLAPAHKAAIAARFIPKHLLQNFDLGVSLMIFGAIAPQGALNGIETTLERVVRQTIARILEHHAKEEQKRYEVVEHAHVISAQNLHALADRMEADSKPVQEVDISKPASPSPAAPSKPAQIVVPAAVAVPATQQLLSTEAFMSRLPQVLREWFAAVIGDPNYETVKTHFVITEVGVEIPAKLLGKYGLQGQTVRQMLENSNVITGRSEDGTRFVFDSAVKGYLFKEPADAA